MNTHFEISLRKALVAELTTANEAIVNDLSAELKAQGYVLSGDLLRSIHASIVTANDKFTTSIEYLDYGDELNKGKSAAEMRRIPLSILINIMLQYALKRNPNMRTPERYKFAINTARKWQQEGKPTKASSRFSTNGFRTQWLSRGLKNIDTYYEIAISRWAVIFDSLLYSNLTTDNA
ncbi:MAG: hypothetical protein WAS72_05930 [Saprospiraceae bacterium]